MLSGNASRGFTLIELAIALTLLAVLMTLGMPVLTVIIDNGRIKSAASTFALGLQSARAQAVSRNATIWFVPEPDVAGWVLSSDSAGTAVIEAKSASESSGNKVAVTVVPDTLASVSFNGLGRPSASADFDFKSQSNGCEHESAGNARCLRVRLSAGGQVRVCDPQAGTGDTRAC